MPENTKTEEKKELFVVFRVEKGTRHLVGAFDKKDDAEYIGKRTHTKYVISKYVEESAEEFDATPLTEERKAELAGVTSANLHPAATQIEEA